MCSGIHYGEVEGLLQVADVSMQWSVHCMEAHNLNPPPHL